MEAKHGDVLVSLLDYLNALDEHLGGLLRANRERVVLSNAHLRDSLAQLGQPDRVGRKILRENGSFARHKG